MLRCTTTNLSTISALQRSKELQVNPNIRSNLIYNVLSGQDLPVRTCQCTETYKTHLTVEDEITKFHSEEQESPTFEASSSSF